MIWYATHCARSKHWNAFKSSVFCLQHTANALYWNRRRSSRVTAFSNSDETYINGIRRISTDYKFQYVIINKLRCLSEYWKPWRGERSRTRSHDKTCPYVKVLNYKWCCHLFPLPCLIKHLVLHVCLVKQRNVQTKWLPFKELFMKINLQKKKKCVQFGWWHSEATDFGVFGQGFDKQIKRNIQNIQSIPYCVSL